MARLIVIAILVVAFWYAALQLYRFLKSRPIDWTGVSFAIGFIVLAFYLHYATGIGM
jgi:hypothetical protein